MKKIIITFLFSISLLVLLVCQNGVKVVLPREMKIRENVNLNNVKKGTKLTVEINPIIPKEYIKTIKVNDDDITDIALKHKIFQMMVFENSIIKIDLIKEYYSNIEIKNYIENVELNEFNFNYSVKEKNLVKNQSTIKNNLKLNNPLVNTTYNIKGQSEEKLNAKYKKQEDQNTKETIVNSLTQNVFSSKLVFGSSNSRNYLLLDNHEFHKLNSVNSYNGFFFDEGYSSHNLRTFSKLLPAGNSFTKSTFSSYKLYENTINDYDFFNENAKTSYNKINNHKTPFRFNEILSCVLNNLDSDKFKVYSYNNKYVLVEKNNNSFLYDNLNIYIIFDSNFKLHSFYFLGNPQSNFDQGFINKSYKFFAEITDDFETKEEKLKNELLFENEKLYNDNLIKNINSLIYNHKDISFNRDYNETIKYINIELYKKIKQLRMHEKLEIHKLNGNLVSSDEKNNFKNYNKNLKNSILLSGIGYQKEIIEETENNNKTIDTSINSINTKIGINFQNNNNSYIEFDYYKENLIEYYTKNKLELTRISINKFVSKNYIEKNNGTLNIYTQASNLFLNYYNNEENSSDIKSLYKSVLVKYNNYNEKMISSHLINVLDKLNLLYQFENDDFINLLTKNKENYFINYEKEDSLYIFVFDLNFNLTKVIYQFKKSINNDNTNDFSISQFELNVINNNYTIPIYN